MLARGAADRALMRRVHLDLTGLPPTPDEVEEFTADTSRECAKKLIDRLLNSAQYVAMARDDAGWMDKCPKKLLHK